MKRWKSKMKKNAVDIFKYLVVWLLGCAFAIAIIMPIVSVEIETLEKQVVEAYDKGYLDGENDAQESFFEDYNFYLLVVVSRERTNTDFVWTYGLQMLDDNSDTAYVDSDKLFSIGEHIVAIELNDNSVILIDLS